MYSSLQTSLSSLSHVDLSVDMLSTKHCSMAINQSNFVCDLITSGRETIFNYRTLTTNKRRTIAVHYGKPLCLLR